MEGLEAGDDHGTVLLVGDAEPLRRGLEHRHGGFAAVDEGVDGEGDVVLALQLVAVFLEEVHEEGLALGEVVGREAEEVHADGGVGGQGVHAAIGVLVFDAVGGAADAGALGHADEQAVGVGLADTAADGTVLAEGVLQTVAHHAVFALGTIEGAQVIGHASISSQSLFFTYFVVIPKAFMSLNKSIVPPYKLALEMISSPASRMLSSAFVRAAIPEAQATEPIPPSNLVIRSSKALTVGLATLV